MLDHCGGVRWWLAGLLTVVCAGGGEMSRAVPPDGLAQEILQATGVRGGLIVHLGCGDGRLTAALRAGDSYLVHGLDGQAENVAAARQHIQSLGLYGPICIDQHSGSRLPYIDNLVNLLVAEDRGAVSPAEVLRVLAPEGVAYVRSGGAWTKIVKARPAAYDEWTHYLHDPSNNAVAHDTAVGPLARFQWIGSPRYSRHHDHMSGISAMVSSGKRVFYIFDESPRPSILIPPQWQLTGRDAFNGTVLWKRPIGPWHEHLWPLKSGPQMLPRRMVADGERLFVTLGIDAALTALDAATGRTLKTYAGTRATEEILLSGGVLFLVVADGHPLRSDPQKKFATLQEIREQTSVLWGAAPRTIMALQADSGATLWKRDAAVAAVTLAVDQTRVVFHDGKQIVCLDRQNGAPLWKSEPLAIRENMKSSYAPTLVLHKDVVLFVGGEGRKRKSASFSTTVAVSARDGRTLWEAEHPPCGHGTPDDLLVLDDLVWCGAVAQGSDSGVMTGRDLHTGAIKKEFPPDVETHWFHHRCYRAKATDKYLLFSRTGIEFIDPQSSHWTPHHWTRGGCLYGTMPCNGLIYNPPHPCACYIEAKLSGFHALAPALSAPRPKLADEARLLRGPAYGSVAQPQSVGAEASSSDWPTYRHDAARSGGSRAAVSPAGLGQLWETPLSGRLSPVVIADRRLFVAAIDKHTVHALDAQTGRSLWQFTAGGRVDSPPTVWRGLVLFGSADGCVYALRAADGQLAWRYTAAPLDERMVAMEQLESVWPVSGSVLVENDCLYCVAGRSMFLDGGLRLVRLDPQTGRKLSETALDERDPNTQANLQSHVKGLNMPVALPDILSCDGKQVYMRSLPFDLEGQRKVVDYVDLKQRDGDDRHLFSPTGFLDDTMWHRTYWVYGRSFASGAGGYYQAGRVTPAGRLLVSDEQTVYGYGRRWQFYRWTTPLEFHLFAAPKQPDVAKVGEEPKKVRRADGKVKGNMSQTPVMRFGQLWSDDLAVQANAMALAGPTLFVAGPPDVIDEEQAAKTLSDPATRQKLMEQEAAFEGRRGALLVAVSKSDGKHQAAYRLASMPVFDGLAAAGGKLYYATRDGQVVCLAAGAGRALPAADLTATPRSAEADRAAPPPASTKGGKKAAHVAPAPAKTPAVVTIHPDFQHQSAANVTREGLGYRVESLEKQTGVALKKLPTPLTKQAVFRLQMKPQVVAERLQTGFLTLGDGTADERLVHCGIRVRVKKCLIFTGGSAKKSELGADEFTYTPGKPLDVEVAVDLAAGKIKLTLPGKTLEAKLPASLKSITHVGYGVMNAVTEFSPLEVQGN